MTVRLLCIQIVEFQYEIAFDHNAIPHKQAAFTLGFSGKILHYFGSIYLMLSGAQVLRTTKRHSLIWAVRSIISTQLNAINAFCSNAPVATLLPHRKSHAL